MYKMRTYNNWDEKVVVRIWNCMGFPEKEDESCRMGKVDKQVRRAPPREQCGQGPRGGKTRRTEA